MDGDDRLAVNHIIAIAAPSIEHRGIIPQRRRQNTVGERKRLGALFDRGISMCGDRIHGSGIGDERFDC